MSSESEEPKSGGPPPPSIKPPTTPPPPTVRTAPAEPKPASAVSPIKVKVKEGSDEDEELDTPLESDGSQIPVGTRVAATLIDLGIGIGLYVGVLIVANFTWSGFSSLAGLVMIAFIVTRDGLPFLNGQSPGKTAMKIKAVTLEGESLAGNWQPALIRNGVLVIPLFAIIELVVLLTREDKPDRGIRLGDEWAGTRVVKADPPQQTDEPSEEAEKPSA